MNVCVLIRVKPGKLKKVLGQLRGLKGVKEVLTTFGRYDVVIFASVKDYDQAKSITRDINAIKEVKSTETLIEAEE